MLIPRPAGLFAVAAVALTGCPASPSFPPLHPAAGTVTHNGKPVAGGGLIFIPESGTWGGVVIDASINPDGTFTAQTSKVTGTGAVFQPGAPVGTYKVTYHPPSDGSKAGMYCELADPVTVAIGENRFDLVLPSVLPKGGGAVRDDANPPDPDRKD